MHKPALNLYLTLLALLCVFSVAGFALQGEDGSRARSTSKTRTPKTPTTNRRARRSISTGNGVRKPKEKEETAPTPAPATLTVTLSPMDGTVLVNGQKFDSRDQLGRRTTTLKPGEYSVSASKPGYIEETQPITLTAGSSESLNIILRLQPGNLNINPPLVDSSIVVRHKDKDLVIGNYSGSVAALSVEPGRYEITISKSGYKTARREVVVKSGDNIYLEPQLEQEPVAAESAPAQGGRRFAPAPETKIEASRQGKEILVSLTGKSGNTTTPIGSLDVTVNADNENLSGGTVAGILTGFPCQVEFVKPENVAEYSFAETPDGTNQWAKVVVRLRPTDFKRPVRFSINWRPLQSQPLQTAAKPVAAKPAPIITEPATVIRRVSPIYPQNAGVTRVSGVVVVSVEIDEQGNVVSAKALEGPGALRHAGEVAAEQWKFRPARNNGRPISSIFTIRFIFQP